MKGRSVEALLVVPIEIPPEGLGQHEAEEYGGHRENDSSPGLRRSPGDSVSPGDPRADRQASSDARQIEDSLGNNEADVEEEITRRQKRYRQEAEGRRHGRRRSRPR